MKIGLSASLCLAIAVPGLSSCGGHHQDSSPELGVVLLTADTVPADVQCLSLTATGQSTVVRTFDVAPSAPAALTATGLPTGTVMLSESAYNVPCAEVSPNTPQTWTSVPVVAQLLPGQPVPVTIVLHRTGVAAINSVFDDGIDAGVTIDGGVDGGRRDVPVTVDVVRYDVPVVLDGRNDVPVALDVVRYDVPVVLDGRNDVPVALDVVRYDVPVVLDGRNDGPRD
jgi:hypothetical protein